MVKFSYHAFLKNYPRRLEIPFFGWKFRIKYVDYVSQCLVLIAIKVVITEKHVLNI